MLRRIGAVALVFALSASALDCRRSRALAGPPVAGDGVRIELLDAAVAPETITLKMVAYNDTDQLVTVNRNQLAIVGPDGIDRYRSGGREVQLLQPRARKKVVVDVTTGGINYRKASGFYVRFDGVYAGNVRINLPPMAIGQPATGPGQSSLAFAAPSTPTRELSIKERVMGKTSAPAATSGSGGFQQYNGPRRKLQNVGAKCATIPLKAKDISDQMGFIIDELLLTELQQVGFEAIGAEDINAMLGFEKVKEAVGCDDATCIAELGNALGVDYLVAGNVAALDSSVVLTLKLLDTKKTKVLARVNRMGEGGQSSLPRMIAEAVQELVERSAI